MEWTREQKKVIETRNKNLLVSAAAGSGKTAVLVEHIINRITEEGIDIDRLLVVTFTNAAAAEMKERIRKAIEDKLIKDPDNANLHRQAALVHSAQITTIHSFCLSVIRDNFQSLPIDPSFRIAEEAELTLIKSDVLEDLLEACYEEGREDFLAFTESFGGGKTDDGIEDLILNIHQFSMSAPWPEDWYDKLKENFEVESAEDMKTADWMHELMSMLNRIVSDLYSMCEEAVLICQQADGPTAYQSALISDSEQLEGLKGITDYSEFGERIQGISFARLSGKKEEGVDPGKKELVKSIRDRIKKAVSDIQGNYFFQGEEEMAADIAAMRSNAEVLIRLCKDFSAAYQKRKAEKNMVDFNDLEHLALSVLVKKEDGITIPTQAADELAGFYKEVMVDEYQDSNLVQEIILESISGGRFGNPNRFMVGDVKQSIYKFRLADPSIFMDKYEKYPLLAEEETEAEKELDSETKLEQNSEIELEKKSETEIGQNSETELEQNPETELGQYSETKLEQNSETELGQNSETKREQNPEAELGENSETKLEQNPETEMEQDSETKWEQNPETELRQNLQMELEQYLQMELQQASGTELEQDKEPNKITAQKNEDKLTEIRIAEVSSAEEHNLRIDLHKNFRSREVVINSINSVFQMIMTRKLGDIEYDKRAYLYPGADFCSGDGISDSTELLLAAVTPPEAETAASENKKDEEAEEYTARELEALAVAARIKELVHPETGLLVQDKKTGGLRRAVYGDIAILLRSMTGWADIFSDTLSAEGIIAHTETQTGYFKTLEISTTLNLLRTIDNPRQDIPFTAVLKSPMAGFTDGELADIRMIKKRVPMYEAAKIYSSGKEDALAVKLEEFFERLSRYRSAAVHLPIHELILHVLSDTGYYNYAAAMPAGDKRKANLNMLVQQAIRFEGTSFSGLFHFIRYMERLDRYDVDFGEAKVTGEDDKSVRIMSIHKSKGLEFPIVFVAGMGKNFNTQDSRAKLLLHQDYGIGMDYIDLDLRIKEPTLIKKFIQKQLITESLGEELRVLYVALTRAKEKLILTAGVKDMKKLLEKYALKAITPRNTLSYLELSAAASYLDWIMLSMIQQKGFEELLLSYGLPASCATDDKLSVREYTYEMLLEREKEQQVVKEIKEDILLNRSEAAVYDEKYKRDIKAYFEYKYPYQAEAGIHTKVTVSELKKMGQQEEEELSEALPVLKSQQEEYPVPAFLKEIKEEKGADLGTLIHKVLELTPFEGIYGEKELTDHLDRLVKEKRLLPEELKILDIGRISRLYQSELGQRLRMAESEGRLFKERQFIMGVKAKDINGELQSEELVLVQGVIDAYFIEGNELVLVDYKSDAYVTEEKLKSRYHMQLKHYQKALEQLTGMKVKESIIYSVWLSRQVIIE
ncbi:UvrD-helicase domain-containing protein [Clostridium sp. KNHs205]|uniref:UvrD-helicase domain-containing protein n=1 Tax=Clostridium sp. KNHs205 TaxID=1449050 RepID=UPI000691D353|nr:UvrD-helicase domain-containing protein [Clostridium sp. KNHs205]